MFVQNIKVEISKVIVKRDTFSFNYKCWKDGKLILDDSYDGNHSWEEHEEYKFLEILRNGYAVDIVLSILINSN